MDYGLGTKLPWYTSTFYAVIPHEGFKKIAKKRGRIRSRHLQDRSQKHYRLSQLAQCDAVWSRTILPMSQTSQLLPSSGCTLERESRFLRNIGNILPERMEACLRGQCSSQMLFTDISYNVGRRPQLRN
jgi:hypothetical protein